MQPLPAQLKYCDCVLYVLEKTAISIGTQDVEEAFELTLIQYNPCPVVGQYRVNATSILPLESLVGGKYYI